ncbi:MAG: 50S ribosomal protein L9 [Pseudohongiella sp.]|jgi:large subunit ribosomal protein L9|nr:50S ribosomal protein L9 [Pseudohongiella sp.]
MNVILLEKIGNLGGIGDTANVKAGFARNFLFPQGKAIPATKTNLVDFEARRAELLAAHDENVAASQKRKDKVQGAALTIEVNAGDDGRLFGSVGTRDIAEALNAQVGSEVSKSEVALPNGVIRELGHYEVVINLGYEVRGTISLAVVGLGAAVAVTDDGSLIKEIDDAEAAAAEDSGREDPAE